MVPDEIRQLRARLGLTQAELAARLGVALNTVTRWEMGNRTPNQYYQLALARLDRSERAPMADDLALAALDHQLDVIAARSDTPTRLAMSAVDHAARRNLSPLALYLAGNAAMEAAHGTTAAEWIMSRLETGLEREQLEAVISELMGAGLWPWG